MFAKLKLAALVGTLATTAFATPALAHESGRDRDDRAYSDYGRYFEHERDARMERDLRPSRHRMWMRERARGRRYLMPPHRTW